MVIDWHKRDRYGRILGKIVVNGSDANLAIVEAGFAWWCREYAGEQSGGDRSPISMTVAVRAAVSITVRGFCACVQMARRERPA